MFRSFPVWCIATAVFLVSGAVHAHDSPDCDLGYRAVDTDQCPQLLRYIELAALRGSLDCHGIPYSAPCVRTHLHQIELTLLVQAKSLEVALNREANIVILREAQTAWKQYRDLQCEVAGLAASEEQQTQQALSDMCRIELTQERLDQLSRLSAEFSAAMPQPDRR